MYDIHSHIICGVDDGSPDMESSRSLLQMAVAGGTEHIVATPHVIEMYDHPSWERINEGVEELRSLARADGLDLEIMAGAEVMLGLDILAAYDEAPQAFCLNSTNYALVELPRFEVPHYTENLFYEMQLRGLVPVLAHPECYIGLFRHPNRILEWCHKGVLLQANGSSLTGLFGPEVQQNLRFLLHNRLVSFIGSDAHRVKGRNTDLAPVWQQLVATVGQTYAEALCIHNPRTILTGGTFSVSVPDRLEQLPGEHRSFWQRIFG